MTSAVTSPTPHLHKPTAAPRITDLARLPLPARQQDRCNGSWESAVMGSTRALILWAQVRVFGSGRETIAVRFIAVSVTVRIRTLHGAAGYPAVGAAIRNHSLCHTIFSMAVSRVATTVRQPVFPAVVAISLPAPLGCGRQFMAATLRLARRTGT